MHGGHPALTLDFPPAGLIIPFASSDIESYHLQRERAVDPHAPHFENPGFTGTTTRPGRSAPGGQA